MPSAFEQEFGESAAVEFMDELGRGADYFDPAPNSVKVTGLVRVNRETQEIPVMENQRATIQRRATLKCLPSFVPVPRINGRFVVDGKDHWTITALPVLRNGQWEMDCVCIQDFRLNEAQAKRN